jgi:hypothetical protein
MAVISKWGGPKEATEGQPQAAATEGAEVTEEQLQQALGESDRRLRRLLRRVGEGAGSESEELEREIKGARRQLRANRELLGWEPSGDAG